MEKYGIIPPGLDVKPENLLRLGNIDINSPLLLFDTLTYAVNYIKLQPFPNEDYYKIVCVNLSIAEIDKDLKKNSSTVSIEPDYFI